jgi:hypothetical protein
MKADDYLGTIMEKILTELNSGLTSLTFKDNHDVFIAENVIIPAGTNYFVSNKLTTIPTGCLVLKQVGNGLITASTTYPWSLNDLAIYNNGAVQVTATIMFMR